MYSKPHVCIFATRFLAIRKYAKTLTMLTLVSACQQQNNQVPQPAQAKTKLDTIQQMVNRQCQKDNQCQAIGFQPLACGGYADYLIYSRWKTSVKQLKQAVNDYNQVKIKSHHKNDAAARLSICLHVARPLLQCDQGICQAKSNHDPR